MIGHSSDPAIAAFFQRAFGKRPAEELYDLAQDPAQLSNVAGDPAYADQRQRLAEAVMGRMRVMGDPRALGDVPLWAEQPYYGPEDTKKNGGLLKEGRR